MSKTVLTYISFFLLFFKTPNEFIFCKTKSLNPSLQKTYQTIKIHKAHLFLLITLSSLNKVPKARNICEDK